MRMDILTFYFVNVCKIQAIIDCLRFFIDIINRALTSFPKDWFNKVIINSWSALLCLQKLEECYQISKATFSVGRYGQLKDMIKEATSDVVINNIKSALNSQSEKGLLKKSIIFTYVQPITSWYMYHISYILICPHIPYKCHK